MKIEEIEKYCNFFAKEIEERDDFGYFSLSYKVFDDETAYLIAEAINDKEIVILEVSKEDDIFLKFREYIISTWSGHLNEEEYIELERNYHLNRTQAKII